MNYKWSEEGGWEEHHPDMVAVEPRPGLAIWVKFADGTEGEHDLSHLSHFPGVFAAWKDRAFFESVYLSETAGGPTWPGAIDLAPDVIWDKLSQTHKQPITMAK